MGRRVRQVGYQLNPVGEKLSFEEIKAILRGADELIMAGGRNLLAKILKASRDKKLLELKLDQNPVYGYYKELTLAEITARIDRAIADGYLKIEYNHRLPVLVYTEKGWEIEKETYAEELLEKLKALLNGMDYTFVKQLKDRDREMILLLLEKIEATGDRRFIPLLHAWAFIEYKEMRKAIHEAINSLKRKQ
ncbi:MAG: RQC domain protein [Firmicutes bacterium]|nr:RQC domain protein [Bacillota bacterium]